jgi:hypothetical protein
LITHLYGLSAGRDTGLNAAFVNVVKTMDNGANVAFLNITQGLSNLDLGGLSISEQSHAQLGFINVTKEIRDFQFGLLNFAENGFFPVFPIVNFPKK